ncbi:TPA: DUF1016 family protein [Legionella pneumophila subsp. pneumophila]|nr:DUF1016 family protein [Legionella pneumophila subsp. pneumophila]
MPVWAGYAGKPKNNRAEYGQGIIENLSHNLMAEYGRSFEEKNLRRMIQFSEIYR